MLIQNGVIHTMDGPVIPNGYVWMEEGRIAGVGPMADCPRLSASCQIVDAAGGHVTPGFVDAHCHVGLYETGNPLSMEELNESADPCTAHLRALDGVNPMDEYFARAREVGVTCVVTGPGSANPIAGQMTAMKTAGRVVDQMVLRPLAAMKLALGENPKRVHRRRNHSPMTRMATAAIIRDWFTRAWEYADKLDSGTRPPHDPRLAALVPVVRGELPVHIHAHRADDIATSLRLSWEFGLDCVVVHGTEGHLIPDLLAQENIPVITGPLMLDKCKPELLNLDMRNTAILAKAGVQVAICSDHPETPIQYLPLCAALAARAGMDEEEALAAITINAACIAKVDERVGSLTVGKDGDLVVLSGPPLDFNSKVMGVYIDGREVTG